MEESLHNRHWQYPERIERSGKTVALAPLNPAEDVADLFALSHTPPEYQDLWRYLPYGPFASEAAMQDWLLSIHDLKDPLFFTVTHLESGRKVGLISIMRIASEVGCAELGHIWYSPLVQRTKVNTETVFLLLAYLFDDLQYRRVEWKCHNENIRSKNAAQRLGFTPEGLFRQHMIVKGRNRDTAWFAMLDKEWPEKKAHFEAYLYGNTGCSLAALNGFRPAE